jgi:hypothetical protein
MQVIGILTAFLRARAACTSSAASQSRGASSAFWANFRAVQLVATAKQNQKSQSWLPVYAKHSTTQPKTQAATTAIAKNWTSKSRNNTIFYRRAFVALPAAAALIYLPVLFSAEAFRHVLLALLSLTSLGGTVYILLYVHSAPAAVDSSNLSAAMIDSRGPLDIALPWLNAALTAVLALSGVLAWKRDLVDEAWRAFLPAGLSPSSTALSYALLTSCLQPSSSSQCTLVLNSFLSTSLAWNVSSIITRVLDYFRVFCMNI